MNNNFSHSFCTITSSSSLVPPSLLSSPVLFLEIGSHYLNMAALSAILAPVEVRGVPAAELWGPIAGACWEQDF